MKRLQSQADGMTACKTTWRSLTLFNGEQYFFDVHSRLCPLRACGVCVTGWQEIALSAIEHHAMA